MIIHANCKINIGLDILRRRDDGFHDLSTLMYPVLGFYDIVEVVRFNGLGVDFSSVGIPIDCSEEKNLCVCAFRLMQRIYNIDGVSITLDKRVPFGAGLGGGSSDATAVLLAINELFDLDLSESQLILHAAELGSDTAFFVRNTPQLCEGRGEIMTPYDLDIRGLKLLIIKPDAYISTREAFSGVYPCQPEMPLQKRITYPIEQWQRYVTNDFERHLFATHPEIVDAKRSLLNAGAIYASMSGSGSAVYGLFDGKTDDEKLLSLSPYLFEL